VAKAKKARRPRSKSVKSRVIPARRIYVKNKAGKFTKFKSDRKLYFYVKDKKGKLRPLYKDKKPRRLTSTQFRILGAEKNKLPTAEIRDYFTFTIVSEQMIIDQVAKHGVHIMKMIKLQLKSTKTALLHVRVKFRDGTNVISAELAVTKDWTRENIVKAIAKLLIVDVIQSINYRFSPKKYSNRKNDKRPRKNKAEVTLYVARY